MVSGSAKVYGNAKVYNNAWVYGNAEVYGNAICTKKVFTCNFTKNNITVTDKHIAIGCEMHTFKYWFKNIKKIGQRTGKQLITINKEIK